MRTLLLCYLAFFSLSQAHLRAEEPPSDMKPSLVIPRVASPPVFEKFLTMKPAGVIGRQMLQVGGFIQQTPKDGEPASQKTSVYLGYDDKNLYAVFVAFDSQPDKVRARLNRRESVFSDDLVEIMLDTFHDQRRAVAFVANPLGVQWDALWTEGARFDGSFDTLWYSKGRLTDQGFVVWMAIPFKSLRFPSNSQQTWGVILVRRIQRGSQEKSFWPHISSRLEGRLNQAGSLKINGEISPGRNMQVIPYGTYRTFRLLDGGHPQGPRFTTDGIDPDAGVDAKFVVKDNLALDLTLNPDFNQVESDRPQVTVNERFEVFFPEKRPFFLENSNFFRSPINLVFTRRIADPQFGVRLTGKAGPYALGALLIDDQSRGKRVAIEDPLHGKRAGFGIFRLSRDILSQSNIGFIYTDREFDDSYNRVGGVDGRIKLDRNWTSSFQAIGSWSRLLDGERFSDPAFSLQLDRVGRQFNMHYSYLDIGEDFRTDTGFIPRTDIRDLFLFNSYRFRPEGKFLIFWGPDLSLQRIWDHDGTRLDERLSTFVAFNFSGQTQIGLGFDKQKELLRPGDADGVTVNKDFSLTQWDLEFKTAFVDEFGLEAELEFGTAVNFIRPDGQAPELGNVLEGNLELNFLPSTQFRIDNNYLFSRLNDRRSGERVFTNHILRSRWNWQFDRKLSLRLIFQYDVTLFDPSLSTFETKKNFNVDFLVTYLVNPWTALFVGVNSNYQNLDLMTTAGSSSLRRTGNSFLNDGRQFFVKYSYLFRF